MAKKKMELNYEKMGSPTLRKAEMEDALVLRGTLSDNVNEGEVADREAELEEDTTPEKLKKELREATPKKKKKK
ncbi:hypothetical protein H0N95_02495 [Candidatus Micrarchaeota archaeon]|nr:hypothetical protein [Candidatus Micrarchaeota archaeon]